MTNLDSILKSRDITLSTKVRLVKARVFPVVMYGYESWTIKKAECWRIGAFELWCCRRLLRVPWTARRSNQSILKEISPGVHWKDWCWSWYSSTLATWCKELTHLKRLWCWEALGAGEGDNGRWDGWMASLTLRTWVWVDSGSWWWTGGPGVLQFMGSQRIGHDWATEPSWMKKVHVQTNGSTCIISLNSYVTPHEGGPFYKWGNRFNTCQCFHIPFVMVALLRFMLCFLVPLKMQLILALQTWSGQHWGPPAP